MENTKIEVIEKGKYLSFEMTNCGRRFGYADGKIENDREFFLDYIYILPEYRRKKLGVELLHKIEETLKDLGISQITGEFIPQGLSIESLKAFYEYSRYVIEGRYIKKQL